MGQMGGMSGWHGNGMNMNTGPWNQMGMGMNQQNCMNVMHLWQQQQMMMMQQLMFANQIQVVARAIQRRGEISASNAIEKTQEIEIEKTRWGRQLMVNDRECMRMMMIMKRRAERGLKVGKCDEQLLVRKFGHDPRKYSGAPKEANSSIL